MNKLLADKVIIEVFENVTLQKFDLQVFPNILKFDRTVAQQGYKKYDVEINALKRRSLEDSSPELEPQKKKARHAK